MFLNWWKKNIFKPQNVLFLALLLTPILLFSKPAFALRYDLCKSPKQSLPCAVAFEKLRTFTNPINKKKFFDDEVHIKGSKLIKIPQYHIAQPDLDHDGMTEIIVALSEDTKSKGLFCQSKFQCPHFVIQDRNPEPKKPRLRYYSTIGKTYAYGIGLSTNENLGGYQSLRVYKTNKSSQFNTYQYDQETDQYYDLGRQGGMQ